MSYQNRAYLPTPEEIQEQCEKIQKGWSPIDREARRVYKTQVLYVTPTYRISHRKQSTIGTRVR